MSDITSGSTDNLNIPDKANLPVHVAVIMDGNGRWAKNQGMIRSKGHLEGLKSAKKIAEAAADLGIKYLTLYVFSTENWKRTEQEVGFLMDLIRKHLLNEFDFYKSHHIRIKHIGDINGLPKDIQQELISAMNDTKDFTDGLTLTLAINYGGRDEILRAIKKLNSENKDLSTLDENQLAQSFDIPSLPDVDLLIRTGGEKRLSNFLLWNSAYAELLFTDTLWPDYNKKEFYDNIIEYQKRTRRFGAVPV